MAREMERAGLLTATVISLTDVALKVGANRVVRGGRFSAPVATRRFRGPPSELSAAPWWRPPCALPSTDQRSSNPPRAPERMPGVMLDLVNLVKMVTRWPH